MKISVNIVVPLSVETASENALVGGLLVRSCKKYPDFTVLSKKLSSESSLAMLTSSREYLSSRPDTEILITWLSPCFESDEVRSAP